MWFCAWSTLAPRKPRSDVMLPAVSQCDLWGPLLCNCSATGGLAFLPPQLSQLLAASKLLPAVPVIISCSLEVQSGKALPSGRCAAIHTADMLPQAFAAGHAQQVVDQGRCCAGGANISVGC